MSSRYVFELDKQPQPASASEQGDGSADDVGRCVGLWFLAMQEDGGLRFESAGPMYLTREYERQEGVKDEGKF